MGYAISVMGYIFTVMGYAYPVMEYAITVMGYAWSDRDEKKEEKGTLHLSCQRNAAPPEKNERQQQRQNTKNFSPSSVLCLFTGSD